MSWAITWLERTSPFPPQPWRHGPYPGLVAGGGDLSPERLLRAYELGLFPWYQRAEPILWWSPDPRGVLFPQALHVSRRTWRTLRRSHLQVYIDRHFSEVIRACAEDRPGESGTWIHPEMIAAYERLFHLGHAHAFALYEGTRLIGGLYGVVVGRIFCAESMFSRRPDASKLCLICAVHWLAQAGCPLIDIQLLNPHTASLGGREITREHYLAILKHERLRSLPEIWQPDIDLMQFLQGLISSGSEAS